MATILTYGQLASVAGVMPEEFDSHDFLAKAQQIFPVEYAEEVISREQSRDPVLQAHAVIARRLLRVETLRPLGKVLSVNCRGRKTLNERWKRV